MNARTLLITGALVAGLAGGPASAQSPMLINFASAFAPTSITNEETIPAFIEAAAEGTIRIEHYPGGTLGVHP